MKTKEFRSRFGIPMVEAQRLLRITRQRLDVLCKEDRIAVEDGLPVVLPPKKTPVEDGFERKLLAVMRVNRFSRVHAKDRADDFDDNGYIREELVKPEHARFVEIMQAATGDGATPWQAVHLAFSLYRKEGKWKR